ncbi:hypothetical protein IT570_03330 [Candidatus Sumerlaeota bacterium]|nr:hypothetical protein [Candidatus Sumerlaeota bacterium]
MEKQVHKAQMSLLPIAANSYLFRSLTTVRSEMGEAATPPVVTSWPLRSYFIRLKNETGSWTNGGIQTRSRAEILIASGNPATVVVAWNRSQFWGRTAWGTSSREDLRPVAGDMFQEGDVRSKIVAVKYQGIEGNECWLVEVERT